jgi:8-oxo-dGTP pyrophosphatase MutT (NUDIX family)
VSAKGIGDDAARAEDSPLRALLRRHLDFSSLDTDGPSTAHDDREVVPEGTVIRDAAVLIPIILRAEPQILLTLRPQHLRRHAGQVSFPGGGIDAADKGPVAAALREAEEEVGLPFTSIEPCGSLPRFLAPSGFRIVPIIGLVDPEARLKIDPAEVVEAFEVPFALLMDRSRYVAREALWRGRLRAYHEIEFGPRRIWGITAGILLALSHALDGTSEKGG